MSLEDKILLGRKTATASAAERQNAPNKLPAGKIGKVNISRIICGGNLINGFAHARDLLYVSSLLRHYFTDEKIMETWEKCEENGINTMVSTVYSPYAKDQGYVDVRDIKPGTKVTDPYTGKIFLVP